MAPRDHELVLNPPSIWFKKTNEKSSEKDDQGNYKTLDLQIDPEDEDNDETVEKKVRLFGDKKTPERRLKWRIEFDEVVRDKPLHPAESKMKNGACITQRKGQGTLSSGQSSS